MTVLRRRGHRRMAFGPICHPLPLPCCPTGPRTTEGDPMTDTTSLPAERADLLESLATHRNFLRFTVRGLTDEQATARPTASELTLAGLIKHVAGTEAAWVRFIEGGPEAMSGDW